MRVSKEEGKSSKSALQTVKKLLQRIDPTKDQLIQGLEGTYLNRKQAQYILETIGNKIQSNTKAIALAKTSIEHVFPQNAKKTDWPSFKPLEDMVWHLGNLTLLEPKINKDLGNVGFAEKQKYYTKSEISMTKELASIDSAWSEEAIRKRAVGFIKQVEAAWQVK